MLHMNVTQASATLNPVLKNRVKCRLKIL